MKGVSFKQYNLHLNFNSATNSCVQYAGFIRILSTFGIGYIHIQVFTSDLRSILLNTGCNVEILDGLFTFVYTV